MALDVDWAGNDANPYRIFVPRADMSVVQASPEIRELDVDAFRLELKDLEASVEGMPWPDTHTHDTEATLSGLVYARRFRILSPYTVEFEDGQYAVRAVGANHNILDVKIANQVSLLVQNSAGLISGTAIEERVTEIYRLLGLDASRPLVVTPTQRTAGSEIDQDIVENPPDTITVTRK